MVGQTGELRREGGIKKVGSKRRQKVEIAEGAVSVWGRCWK